MSRERPAWPESDRGVCTRPLGPTPATWPAAAAAFLGNCHVKLGRMGAGEPGLALGSCSQRQTFRQASRLRGWVVSAASLGTAQALHVAWWHYVPLHYSEAHAGQFCVMLFLLVCSLEAAGPRGRLLSRERRERAMPGCGVPKTGGSEKQACRPRSLGMPALTGRWEVGVPG